MRLLLRSFFLSMLRFLALLVMVVSIQNFDFRPLPLWTAVALAYVLHFIITYLFAIWAFHRHTPDAKAIAMVVAVFLFFGTLWEALFYLFVSQGTMRDLIANYHWQSLYLVAIYVIAVVLAGYRIRRKHIKASLPEGLEA